MTVIHESAPSTALGEQTTRVQGRCTRWRWPPVGEGGAPPMLLDFVPLVPLFPGDDEQRWLNLRRLVLVRVSPCRYVVEGPQ